MVVLTAGAVLALVSSATLETERGTAADGVLATTVGRPADPNDTQTEAVGSADRLRKNGTETILSRAKRLTSFGRPAETAPDVPKQGRNERGEKHVYSQLS